MKLVLIKLILISYKIKLRALDNKKSIENIHYFNRLTNRVVFKCLNFIPSSDQYLLREYYLDYIFFNSNIIVKYREKVFYITKYCKYIYCLIIYLIIQFILISKVIKNIIKIAFRNNIKQKNAIIFFGAPINSLVITNSRYENYYLSIGDYIKNNYTGFKLIEIEKDRQYSLRNFEICKFRPIFSNLIKYRDIGSLRCSRIYYYFIQSLALVNNDIYKLVKNNVYIFNLASSVIHGIYKYDVDLCDNFHEISYSQNWTAWPTKYLNTKNLEVGEIKSKQALMEYSVDCYVGWGRVAGFTDIYDNARKIRTALNRDYKFNLPLPSEKYIQKPILLGFNKQNKVRISESCFNIIIYDVFPYTYDESLDHSFTGVAGYDHDFCINFYNDILNLKKLYNLNIFTKLKYGKHRYRSDFYSMIYEREARGDLTILSSDVNLANDYKKINLAICMPYVSMKIFYECMGISSIYYSPSNFEYLTNKASVNSIIVGSKELNNILKLLVVD